MEDALSTQYRTLVSAAALSLFMPTLAGCGGMLAASTDESTPSASSTKTAWPSCEDLISDVVEISQDNGEPNIIQVYSPTVTSDRTADFDSGALTIPEGENKVTVLECTGTSAWSDQDELPLNYRLEIDTNRDSFVAYELVEQGAP